MSFTEGQKQSGDGRVTLRHFGVTPMRRVSGLGGPQVWGRVSYRRLENIRKAIFESPVIVGLLNVFVEQKTAKSVTPALSCDLFVVNDECRVFGSG